MENFDDRALFPPKKKPAKFWRFGDSPTPSTFTLFYFHDEVMRSHRIHRNYSAMLAFLDLNYRRSLLQVQGQARNAGRISQYLQSLRNEVERELQCEQPNRLTQKSWRSKTVKQWAVRVYHSCGHSETGRTQYTSLCKGMNKVPYDEDPTEYGE
jgi:hypothetical protein